MTQRVVGAMSLHPDAYAVQGTCIEVPWCTSVESDCNIAVWVTLPAFVVSCTSTVVLGNMLKKQGSQINKVHPYADIGGYSWKPCEHKCNMHSQQFSSLHAGFALANTF